MLITAHGSYMVFLWSLRQRMSALVKLVCALMIRRHLVCDGVNMNNVSFWLAGCRIPSSCCSVYLPQPAWVPVGHAAGRSIRALVVTSGSVVRLWRYGRDPLAPPPGGRFIHLGANSTCTPHHLQHCRARVMTLPPQKCRCLSGRLLGYCIPAGFWRFPHGACRSAITCVDRPQIFGSTFLLMPPVAVIRCSQQCGFWSPGSPDICLPVSLMVSHIAATVQSFWLSPQLCRSLVMCHSGGMGAP